MEESELNGDDNEVWIKNACLEEILRLCVTLELKITSFSIYCCRKLYIFVSIIKSRINYFAVLF